MRLADVFVTGVVSSAKEHPQDINEIYFNKNME